MTHSQEVNASTLKKLPLHSEHEVRRARFGAFGEWWVPLYFTSVLDEHETVRHGVGVFDISHMGEMYVDGPDARKVINQWITNDVEKLHPGRALYSPVCRENGGIVDDVIVYECMPDQYLIVVNAANIDKDYGWFQSHLNGRATLQNVSEELALLAVQGPTSRDVVSKLFDIDLSRISYYDFTKLKSSYGEIILAETGYTGEEGFEIFCPVGQVARLWHSLFQVGTPFGLKPIGFGARDTLRLEARFLLYGHDMTDETTPLEAGLAWTVGWEKEKFIGKDALVRQKTVGVQRKLIGFELEDRGIARGGSAIFISRREVGTVTSGTYSPTLKKSIGLGYIASGDAHVGQALEIRIRGKLAKAEIVKTPFYKREKIV